MCVGGWLVGVCVFTCVSTPESQSRKHAILNTLRPHPIALRALPSALAQVTVWHTRPSRIPHSSTR